MTREEATELLNQYNLYSPTKQIEEALDMAIEALQTEPTKAVPPSLADVYKWERDIALSQLEEYGIGFAEKKRDDLVEVVRCKDCRWQEECSQFVVLHMFCGVYQEISFCSHGERRDP